MNPEQIKAMVAIHEAGHAVASCILQVPFKEIQLHPLDGPGNFGSLIRMPGSDIAVDDGDPAERERVEKMIVCLLAGPAAESRYTGASPWLGGGTDLPTAVQYACRRFAYGTEADLKAEISRLWLRARELVYSSEGWDCVQRIAAVLEAFERVSRDLCGRLIREQQLLRSRNASKEVIAIMDGLDYARIAADLASILA